MSRIYSHPLQYLAILLVLLGTSILFSSRQSVLVCQRDTEDAEKVDCVKSERVSLGLLELNAIKYQDVQAVRLDTKIKKILESTDAHGSLEVKSRDVYGVLIETDSTSLLDAYDYDRDRQEKRVLKIDAFLKDKTQKSMAIQMTNAWSGLMTIFIYLAAGYCFYKSRNRQNGVSSQDA